MPPQDPTIARAVLVSNLISSSEREHIPDVARDDAMQFAKTLTKTCNICTSSNVQSCTCFIVTYILNSSVKLEALTKYLLQLSISFEPKDYSKRDDTPEPLDRLDLLAEKSTHVKVQQPTPPAFKRLHVLYIIHDVLLRINTLDYVDDVYDTRRSPERSPERDSERESERRPSRHDMFDSLQSRVCTLAELAACHSMEKGAKTTPMVMDLVDIWNREGIFTSEQIKQMRDNILLAEGSEWGPLVRNLWRQDGGNRLDERRRAYKIKYAGCLPANHGVIDNPDAPWYKLPAANAFALMCDIGFDVKEWYFNPLGEEVEGGLKPPSPDLEKEVMHLYNEVVGCHDKYTNAEQVQDIDAMGNIIWKDPERITRNYWGFPTDAAIVAEQEAHWREIRKYHSELQQAERQKQGEHWYGNRPVTPQVARELYRERDGYKSVRAHILERRRRRALKIEQELDRPPPPGLTRGGFYGPPGVHGQRDGGLGRGTTRGRWSAGRRW